MGEATIRPSVRVIETAGGSAVAEPRVMQVLLAFVDARGAVLTRDDLIRGCWSGAVVGEDAVNRAVSEIRRIARVTGAGFGVETIPRVGYRLTGYETPVPIEAAPRSPESPLDAAIPAQRAADRAGVSRRWVVVAAAAAVAATGVTALVWQSRRTDPRFAALMEQGREAMRLGMPGSDRKAATAFQAAVEFEPDDAPAWGLLALSLRGLANVSNQTDAAGANQAADRATRRALQLDPREPHALLTRMLMQWRSLDWLAMENELHRILSIDPSNPQVLNTLVAQLQAAGYVRESWDYNERVIAFDAIRPVPQFRKALKLWILGEPDAADQQAEFTMRNWPLNNLVRNARLMVSAFTGRVRAAYLLLDDENTTKGMLSAQGIGMWKSGLAALESRSAADVSTARSVCLAAAPTSPGLAVAAVMLLSELNEVDAAYEVVEGFLLRRGLRVARDRAGTGTEFEVDMGWRSTQWLYTPATKPLREDPRFALLADVIGLTQYWSRRGSLPDERRASA